MKPFWFQHHRDVRVWSWCGTKKTINVKSSWIDVDMVFEFLMTLYLNQEGFLNQQYEKIFDKFSSSNQSYTFFKDGFHKNQL